MKDEVTVRLPGAVIRRLDAVADEMNLDRLELILEAIDLSLRRYEEFIAAVYQAAREVENGTIVAADEIERRVRSWGLGCNVFDEETSRTEHAAEWVPTVSASD